MVVVFQLTTTEAQRKDEVEDLKSRVRGLEQEILSLKSQAASNKTLSKSDRQVWNRFFCFWFE